ncbi:DUF6173 family protein [Bacillus massiliigorillae]|uniref:DUF6173 family protein n=1 Tax=Bacillus massiliigorillae TaxID=1243664 RepID=UPI0003A91961|nr:DUF6173 family protein [Bacillus massiliigorillae]
MSVETTLATLNIDPEILSNKQGQEKGLYTEILNMVRDFELNLNEDEKVGISLVNNGQAFHFYLTGLHYSGSDMIRFEGITDAGTKVNLIQHKKQLNFLLISLPKLYNQNFNRVVFS